MPKVLIVDDDSDVCRVLVRLLKHGGLDASFVTSGQEGLDFVRSQPTDVILLDLMMPVMTGFDVLRVMRASEDLATLPVIIYSGRADAEAREEARLLGAQDFLTKGGDSFEYLQAVLKKYAERNIPPA